MCLLVLVVGCSAGRDHGSPPASPAPGARNAKVSAAPLGDTLARGATESIRVPAGWSAVPGPGPQGSSVHLVAPCGQALISLDGPLPNPSRQQTVLGFVRAQIVARGSKAGIAKEPHPAPDLGGSPTLEVDFGSNERQLVTYRNQQYFRLAMLVGPDPCVDGLGATFDEVARSWTWTA